MKSVPDAVKHELCARFGGDPSTLRFLGGGQGWSDGKDRIAKPGAFYRAMGDLLGRLHAIAEARFETLSPDGTSDASSVLRGWREEWTGFRV